MAFEIQNVNNLLALILGIFICALLITHGLASLHRRGRLSWLSEAGLTMLFGMFLSLCKADLTSNRYLGDEVFTTDLFKLALLPPIILHSAFSMKKRNFFENATPILTFTLFGTVLSALLFAVCIYTATMLPIWINGNTLNWRECLIFGALIAPVDPVATLAIMKHANADPFLFSVTFGESMLNDPVSVIMYHTLEESHTSNAEESFLKPILLFLWVSFGSIIIGLVVAAFSAIISKNVQFRSAAYDDVYVLTFAVLAYTVAEILEASGIAAIFSAGLFMSHYTWYNLSDIGQLTVRHTIRTIATLAELVIFLNLGDFMTSFDRTDWEPNFIIFACFFLIVSRGVVVFFLSYFLNFGKKMHHAQYLTWRHQFLLAVSGLRGAFSFSLAVHLDGHEGYKNSGVIITTTLVLILFTVIVLGGITGPLLRRLGLTCPESSEPRPGTVSPLLYVPEEESSYVYSDDPSAEEFDIPHSITHNQPLTWKEKFERYDATVLRPLFTRKLSEPRPRLLFDATLDVMPSPLPRKDVVIANINDLPMICNHPSIGNGAPSDTGSPRGPSAFDAVSPARPASSSPGSRKSPRPLSLSSRRPVSPQPGRKSPRPASPPGNGKSHRPASPPPGRKPRHLLTTHGGVGVGVGVGISDGQRVSRLLTDPGFVSAPQQAVRTEVELQRRIAETV